MISLIVLSLGAAVTLFYWGNTRRIFADWSITLHVLLTKKLPVLRPGDRLRAVGTLAPTFTWSPNIPFATLAKNICQKIDHCWRVPVFPICSIRVGIYSFWAVRWCEMGARR